MHESARLGCDVDLLSRDPSSVNAAAPATEGRDDRESDKVALDTADPTSLPDPGYYLVRLDPRP